MNSENLKIYEMQLHEVVLFNEVRVLRVPGGWIYFHDENRFSTFVPFNNEFQIPKK